MDKGLPCAALNSEELERAKDSAAAGLNRQRQEVICSDKEDSPAASGSEGPLVGQKSGPVTHGPAWDGDVTTEKGLVISPEGWRCVCEHDCAENWSTSVLPAEHLPALVELYKLHVAQCHAKKTTTIEEERFDRDKESYKEVTKIRTIGAHVDNRLDTLSYVRFLPMPLQYQHIAEKQPAQQSPVWDRIDLSHCGLNLADTTIVAKIHNMAYAGGRLRDFSSSNLGMSECDKDIVLKPNRRGTLRQTKNVKSIDTMEEAIGALMNYVMIWRFIHPMDYGATAIFRFLMDRIHHPIPGRRMTSVAAVCGFFQSAFKGNADRVLGPHHPRTYQELVSFYNSMDWTSTQLEAGSETSQEYGSPRKSEFKTAAGKRAQTVSNDGEKKRLRLELCYAFNSNSGCPRSKGEKCVRNGKHLLHVCSHVEQNGSVCGAKDHGLKGHK